MIITHPAELLAKGGFCDESGHCLPMVSLLGSRDSLKCIVTQMALVKLSGSQDKKERQESEKGGLTGLKGSESG